MSFIACGNDLRDRVKLYAEIYTPARGNGLLTGNCPTLDAKQLPLYQSACEMLGCQKFMSEGKILQPAGSMSGRLQLIICTGGYLGFFCAHAYAHTNAQTTRIPDMLKGIDMAIWETFTDLGLEIMVRPVSK